MKKYIIILFIILFIFCNNIFSQSKLNAYAIAFYNVENLFDTKKDEGVRDDDFTPKGAYAWTQEKYKKKLNNLAFVINNLGKQITPMGPAVIGVCEVENRGVLEDLVATKPIDNVGYKIVHYDSPDLRGIDVALLYNPKLFQLISSKTYPYILPDNPDFKTRDQLLVSGTIAGETVHIIVNHWPSKYGSKSQELREHAASISKHIIDSIQNVDSNAKIILMGDLNDDPTDKSVRLVLNAKKKQEEVKAGGLFNTMWAFYDRGIGSLGYKGQWNLFDQIIITESLLGKDRSTLKFWKAEIFNKDYLIQQEGKNKGYPHRTFSGNTFINGYSDHFPTLIYLVKEE